MVFGERNVDITDRVAGAMIVDARGLGKVRGG